MLVDLPPSPGDKRYVWRDFLRPQIRELLSSPLPDIRSQRYGFLEEKTKVERGGAWLVPCRTSSIVDSSIDPTFMGGAITQKAKCLNDTSIDIYCLVDDH